ncbi:ankyrin repeat-containing protein [Talaromyces pinophilus]|uniref:Ankyrin repeat-containing protein n=1 Tax=Talaromyces pinophilus TaxID=128442 RepID=A0A6N4SLL4_TALPI|nr:ankyrin repeat-containing protein [Talaromyces pinophilus]
MSTKAPRIPASVWDGYREEITALYTAPDGTLEKVMDAMKARHGFQPTKSQYLTKLNRWDLQKYANALDYTYADQQIKKRALEGKDTAFNIRGKKMSRKDMEREIGRNTTLTSRLQYVKDIPKPEGVQVFTPSGEENCDSITLEANIDNSSEFQALTVQMFHDQFFQSTIYNMPDSHRVQVDILRNPKFGVKLLQMALGDRLKLEDADMFLLIRNPFTGRQTRRNLASYFPPRDDKDDTISCPFRSVDLDMPPQVVALQILLQYFICLTNNDALEDSHLFDAVNWLLEKFDRSLFTYIFDLRTTTSKIFMRKILAASVNSGDTRLVEDILHRGLDFDYRHPHPYEKNLQERYHGALVDLSPLCRKTVERNIENGMFDSAESNDDFWCYYKTTRLTELQYSVYNRNLFLVRRLLSEGADPDSRVTSNWGDTPLQMAARLDYPEIVSILMENGVDVNAPPGRIDGRTALQAAAESGNIETVQLFLRRNADVNAPAGYERGLTALQAAAESGSIEIVRLLLLRNANVNAPAGHNRGLTALQAALMNGHSDIAELLLRSNADIHADPSPHYGLTTIETAISGRNLSMLKILMENGPEERDSTLAICTAAKYGWVQGVRYLLQHE